MAVFFTSDTHFGDARMLWIHRRPFRSVADMDEALLARWNETVGPDDEVWHLGDFAVRKSTDQIAGLLAALHGRKHLVTGNNDGPATVAQAGWASIQPYMEITVDRTPLVLCHYAFRTWRGMGKGWINLHGHSHGRLKPMTRQYDVGVDAWEFRPVTLGAILQSRSRRRISKPSLSPA